MAVRRLLNHPFPPHVVLNFQDLSTGQPFLVDEDGEHMGAPQARSFQVRLV